MNWYPRYGKRCRGRQQICWEDELKLTAVPKIEESCSRQEAMVTTGGGFKQKAH